MPEERKGGGQSGLSGETILQAFQEMSDELKRRDAEGRV